MTFTLEQYKKENMWKLNEYLVNPETSAKRCACCDQLKYAAEFVDCDLFVDCSHPVCTDCLKSRSETLKQKIGVLLHGYAKNCLTCERELKLDQFRPSGYLALNRKCVDCVGSFPKEVFK